MYVHICTQIYTHLYICTLTPSEANNIWKFLAPSSLIESWVKTAWFFLRRQPRIFEIVILVAHQRVYFWVFWLVFGTDLISRKGGVRVQTNSIAPFGSWQTTSVFVLKYRNEWHVRHPKRRIVVRGKKTARLLFIFDTECVHPAPPYRVWFLVAFITGNSSLEPLIEGLYAQIHVNLRWRVFGRNRTGDLTDY